MTETVQEIAVEDEALTAWYEIVNHPRFQETIQAVAAQGIEEVTILSLDPQLRRRDEFKDMTEERALGIVQGMAKVWSTVFNWKKLNEQAIADRLQYQREVEASNEAQDVDVTRGEAWHENRG